MQSRTFACSAILCLLTAASGWSQEARGTIVGKISDPSGAVIPGAQVIVTNVAMGTKATLSTNADGMYLAPLLIPGTYQVEAAASGFKKALRGGIDVRVGDRLDISFVMEIGAAEQSVTVTAETPVLSSESASLGTVVDSKRVANLPLSYGNPFLLIQLTAGVTFNGSVRLDRPFEPTHIVNYSMGGTRGNLNDILIDGTPATSRANGNEVTASYVPPTDVVEEFKVQTATFDAQFGQTQGGVTNISIKSGTNQFHGSAGYSFYRPFLLANDFFNNKSGLPKPDFSFNRWGGSLGGPVVIPKLYNGKNKTFFMWGYEGIHDARPRHDETTNTVPTPAMHDGDFSSLLAGGGSAYAIYDPATRVKLPNGLYQETAFPGNIVPKSRFDPVGAAILSWYPATEKSPGSAVGQGNYRDNSLAERAKYYNTTARVDQNIGDKQRLFVRYSTYVRNSTYNDYFSNAMTGIQFWFYSKDAAFDHVYTISPTLVLNTRYSYNRFIRGSDGNALGEGFDITKLGFSQQYGAQIPKDIARFPRINLSGYISNGFTGENRPTNNQTVSATLTKVAGTHSIRSGFEFRAYQQADKFFSNAQTGQFTFDSTWTRGPFNNSATSPSNLGQSVAALLLGLPGSGSINRAADYVEQSNSWGFFVQDDWKLSPKLTLNLGLRYEFETPLHERYDKSALGFDTAYQQPFSAAAQAAYASIFPAISGGFNELPPSAFALKGGMTFAGLNGNDGSLYNTPKDIFLPRIGLAYQIDNKTVVRTGFGMFAGFLGQRRGDVLQNGFSQNTNMVLTTDNGLTWATTLANPFQNGVAEPQGAAAGYQTYLGQGFSFFNQNPKVPMTLRWQVSLQREVKGFALEASYVGNKTNHIEVSTVNGTSTTPGRNINALPGQYLSTLPTRDDPWNNYLSASIPNPLYNLVPGNSFGTYSSTTISRQTLLSPYPAFGSNAIYTTDNSGYSWYNSLQITAQKRFAKGFTLNASYTFSKWMQAVNLLNPSDPAPVREISDADAPHRINISGIWELPFGKGKPWLTNGRPAIARLVGGWQVSGIWTLQSGFPLAWNNSIYYGDPASILLPADQRTPDHWLNIAGFETASSKQLLSNQLRTWPLRFSTIRRQRQNNVDLALIKNTPIAEKKNLEFRAEALNAFNHPYFPAPNMTVTNPQSAADTGFGQINASTQDNYARRIQLTLRFVF